MLVRATTTFWHGRDLYEAGSLYDSQHPAVLRFGARMFEPHDTDEAAAPVVESATAAPGEKRATVARGRAKKAAE